MTIHRIRMLGDPILRTRCEPIAKPGSAAVRVIIDDLRDTLRDFQSRFGYGRALAAPQIGAPVRIVFVEMEKPWALINPEIVDVDNEDFTVWDDCFSFPNLLVELERSESVTVDYEGPRGGETVQASAAFSELLQHEMDHLDGILAVDRAIGRESLCTREEWERRYRRA